jgi:hypothetical protein
MQKYKFKIKTKSNNVVDNITILAVDYNAAAKKLSQLYLHYEILDAEELDGRAKEVVTFDKVIDLISK